MGTDYKNIKSFDIAVVSMIAVGLVIIGITLFSTLTPRLQADLTSAFDILDLHEQAIASVTNTSEIIRFVWEMPSDFYEEFYVAFEEVMTVPAANMELPKAVASELARNITVAFSNLSTQASAGYSAQSQFYAKEDELVQLPYDGKIMGTMIELSDWANNVAAVEQTVPSTLNLHYEYIPPDQKSFIFSLKLLSNNVGSIR